jgi:hypothetical protein
VSNYPGARRAEARDGSGRTTQRGHRGQPVYPAREVRSFPERDAIVLGDTRLYAAVNTFANKCANMLKRSDLPMSRGIVELVDRLPMTVTSKILKRELA